MLNLTIEYDRETDNRWIAEISEIPGCMAYGATKIEATRNVEALALRVLADRIEHGEFSRADERAGEFGFRFAAAV